MSSKQIFCLWEDRDCTERFQTAVSLHSHTHHSQETLSFIPGFVEKWPVLRSSLGRQCQKSQLPVDFHRAYWTPPLSPIRALGVELRQIQEILELSALVSLTDHDSIQAPLALRACDSTADFPISLEWTVPFDATAFHLGIHNLPPSRAAEITAALERFRLSPAPGGPGELLAALNDCTETLVVLNHPYWDQRGTGQKRHSATLHRFLEKNARLIHAFELNGLRSWEENRKTSFLAKRWGKPLISGGDRHGCEPSATLNLTNAGSFGEFVHEIRNQAMSNVLFMPQYREPTCLRIIQGVVDAVREYPDFPVGSQRWDDRVFHPGCDGMNCVALSTMWKTPPALIERFFTAFRMVENGAIRGALRLVYAPEVDLRVLAGPNKAAW